MIERPRLQARLVGRFDAPVTTITAAAGSGKSSLIALVLEDNRLDPRGRDVVVQLRPRDAERSAMLSAIARQLDVPDSVADDPSEVMGAIYDALWGSAPEDVVIWLDDAHVLDADAVDAIASLARELPTNGHLAVVSRRPLELGTARLRAHGDLIEVGQDDLDLDDDEFLRLTSSLRDPDDATAAESTDTPRHAATAALLAATGGSTASIAFLEEEVVDALSPGRLSRLRRLIALDVVDEAIARELTDDDQLDLAELVRGLPLVAVEGDTIRLHELFRDALAANMAPGELRKIRSLTGDALAACHDYVGAVDAHLAAGDPVSAKAAARRYVMRPATLTNSVTGTRGILRRLDALDGDPSLIAALQAIALQSSDVWSEELAAWRRARDQASETDEEIEVLALHRIAQLRVLDNDPWEPIDDELIDAYERLAALADRHPMAAAMAANIESQSAQARGDVDAALAALDEYHHFGADQLMMQWQRLTDLGWVERVGEHLGPEDVIGLPAGSETFLGYAMWLRGDGDPDLADVVVSGMIDAWGHRGNRIALASTIATGVPIALARGDLDTAAARVARLRELDRFPLPRAVRTFLAVSDGLLAAVLESDEAGAERYASLGRFAEVPQWPRRPHLLALPFVYLVRPESRAALDAMRTGPAITQALDAGRALVALREHGDAGPACTLSWSDPRVLRNHVLPHHLVELVCAADAAGHPRAGELLSSIPHLERQLRRVADQGAPEAAHRAVELLGRLPREAPDTLHLRLLGAAALERVGEVDHDLAPRRRPLELLALLATHGPTTRDDVIDQIWRGYDDDDKASANLRATLAQLQRLLEPDRPSDHDPHYLRANGPLLSLHGITTDVSEFEQLSTAARQADAAGTPGAALEHYLAAMKVYRGDLLGGHDAAWVVLDRVRLRSLAAGASCRIAELVAARGDPEDAAAWARRALALEPLSDRAAAAFVKALLANDDRTNAAAALGEMVAQRERAGVEIGQSLRQLEARLPDTD